MARPREFDHDRALDAGMRLLWSQGYEATPLDDLIGAMRLSKSSFYGAFGNKRDFLLAAVTRYTDVILQRLADDLERGPAREAIARSLKSAFHGAGDSATGCFVQNCAIELAHRDPQVRAKVKHGLDRLEEGYRRAVIRGQQSGEFARRHNPRTLARYLAASLNGLRVLARGGSARVALDEVVPLVLSALA